MKAIFLPIFGLFILALSVSAQTVDHPEKGSTERSALLETLRPPVEKELKQKIVFVINQISVQGTWAFVDGRLRTTDGKVPKWKGTPYAQAATYGAQSDGISALFKRTGSTWRIVTKAIGCTDVCYVDWWKRYKAPKAIFPYTE
jgi:hypothetical protein